MEVPDVLPMLAELLMLKSCNGRVLGPHSERCNGQVKGLRTETCSVTTRVQGLYTELYTASDHDLPLENCIVRIYGLLETCNASVQGLRIQSCIGRHHDLQIDTCNVRI